MTQWVPGTVFDRWRHRWGVTSMRASLVRVDIVGTESGPEATTPVRVQGAYLREGADSIRVAERAVQSLSSELEH